MRWNRTITVIGAHAEGEIGRVITGGSLGVPGATMLDKMNHLNNVDDSLRRFAMFEPRGCAQMSVNLLLPPCRPEADAGFIVMQADACHAMSGSNAICVTTVLLETGILPMTEPETNVLLDTPAGLIRATAHCADGKCERVSLGFVPSFVEHLDLALEVDGIGTLAVDIAWGGAWFALVDARRVGLAIEPGNARALVEAGTAIKAAARRRVSLSHPELAGMDRVEYLMFFDRISAADRILRGGTVMAPGRMDRSPCGTGTAARLAVLHARGELAPGEKIVQRSIIDGEFIAEIESLTTVGGKPAVVPRISGRAWIYSIEQLGVDPGDPFPLGYTLSDTWGNQID